MKPRWSHWIWVLDRGRVTSWSNDGTPLRMVGTHMDITRTGKQAGGERNSSPGELLQKITARGRGWSINSDDRPTAVLLPFASDGIHQIFRVSPQQVRDDATPVLARLHPDDLDDVVASIAQSARDLSPWQHEFQVQFDDGTLRWLRGHALPEREPDGGTLWHGFISDITERKGDETELLRSNHELEQFSYSVSHDMRQPLRMISSFMQLLHRGNWATQLDGEQQEFFSFAIDGAKRLDQMMLALLDYSRVGRKGEPPSWVESRQLLDEALHYLAPARIEAAAQIDIEGDWPPIFVSRDEMLRLLQNLISNALKFRLPERMPDDSCVRAGHEPSTGACVSRQRRGRAAGPGRAAVSGVCAAAVARRLRRQWRRSGAVPQNH